MDLKARAGWETEPTNTQPGSEAGFVGELRFDMRGVLFVCLPLVLRVDRVTRYANR